MALEDYQEMAEILKGIEGKFILSINDHPEMRQTFSELKIKHAKLKYSVAKGPMKDVKELLACNF